MRYSSLCFTIIHINRFHLRYSFVVLFSDPDDYSSITDEGTEHKEDTSNHPEGNSCDIVSILRGVGDDIVEEVDKDKDCGDEETKSGRVGSGRDEEADPGDDDEQCGGKVVHQDVHSGSSGQLHLKTSGGIIRRIVVPLVIYISFI